MEVSVERNEWTAQSVWVLLAWVIVLLGVFYLFVR